MILNNDKELFYEHPSIGFGLQICKVKLQKELNYLFGDKIFTISQN